MFSSFQSGKGNCSRNVWSHFVLLFFSQNAKEEVSKVVFTVQSDSNKVEPGSMSADEFYLIRTQSNEYLVFVDARSEEEYNTSHISSSISLVNVSK